MVFCCRQVLLVVILALVRPSVTGVLLSTGAFVAGAVHK